MNFLNRLDDIVVFNPLTREHLRAIIHMQVERLAAPLRERGMSLELTPAASDQVIADAWDPVYGARPLRRHLEKHLGTMISRKLLGEGIAAGQHLIIDANNNTYQLSVQESTEEAQTV